MEKEDNGGIEIKYISLLKKSFKHKYFTFYLDKKKQTNTFSYL